MSLYIINNIYKKMSSLFFQSQLYVAELCEPVTLTDFLEEPNYPKSPLESLSNSMLPSSDQKPRKVTPTEKSITVFQ
jgi:hypothetical protein